MLVNFFVAESQSISKSICLFPFWLHMSMVCINRQGWPGFNLQLEGEEEMPEEPDAGATAPLGPQKYLIKCEQPKHTFLSTAL